MVIVGYVLVIIVIIYWYSLDIVRSAARLYMVFIVLDIIVLVIVTMVINVCCVLDINVMPIYVLDNIVMDIISVLYCIVQLELKRLVY